MKLFSTEQVSKYHPDKYADQISDAILDAYLAQDPHAHCGIETMVKANVVVLAGEITSTAKVERKSIVQRVADKLGYEVTYILDFITEQSPEIAGGVREGTDRQGAGDQGMMYGYATRETDSRLPFGFDLANRIIQAIELSVAANPNNVFKGDAKCQVTVDLDEEPGIDQIKTVVVSVCHQEGYSPETIHYEVASLLSRMGIDTARFELIVNPAGSWTFGGPRADAGLTGRKIVCDQYGGYCPVGGGAFSGKDPSKVDRSGAYMARKIACDILDEFPQCYEAEVQLAYAIGMADPVSISVKTNCRLGDEERVEWVKENYDLSPAGIIKALDLRKPQYEKLAEGCHYRP